MAIDCHLNLDSDAESGVSHGSDDTDLVTIQVLECEHSALRWENALEDVYKTSRFIVTLHLSPG